jgi:hypothetical protein
MSARGAEEQPHRLDERLELSAALGHHAGDVRERLAAPRAHLDLGRDQLPDEMVFECRSPRGSLDVLEAVREVERARVEDRELLLDRNGEVDGGLELRPGAFDLLVWRETLLVAHGPPFGP